MKEEMSIDEKAQYFTWVKEKAADIRHGRCPHHRFIHFDSREGSGGEIPINKKIADFDELMDMVASEDYILFGVMSTFVFAIGRHFCYTEVTA